MASDAKHKLIDFLERRAFDPVLRAKPGEVSEGQRERLDHVQRATRSEVERYRGYGSAQEVVTNFHRDLHSEPAKKVHRELAGLGLPTLDDVREEFEKLAGDLGLKP